MVTDASPKIAPELIKRLNTQCDVIVSTRDRGNLPFVCWAMGGRVHDDQLTATIWVRADQAVEFLQALHESRTLSAVFNVPASLHTLQLKGYDAQQRPADVADAPVLRQHVDNMVREIAIVNFDEDFVRTVFEQPVEALTAIDFTIGDVFLQTPGPNAGAKLEAPHDLKA